MMPGTGTQSSGRIAVVLHDLRGGGAERIALRLVEGMIEAGTAVDLVVVRKQGEYLGLIPREARIIDLNCKHVYQAVGALSRYLRTERPAGVLSFLTHVNLATIIARMLSRSHAMVAVTEHNHLAIKQRQSATLRDRLTFLLVPLLYRWAGAVVAVSEGVANDVRDFTGLKNGRVKVIYNPVIDGALDVAAARGTDHPWLQGGQPPVFLAAGRLHRQKGFDVLISAFSIVRRSVNCKLIIMGEGEERSTLSRLASQSGFANDIDLIGFIGNPYGMMARAKVFVLSSRWEGLPTVLIEAMACGAPVVSTDCPSGPSEILERGRYGALVPVEDADALAYAMRSALYAPALNTRQRALDFGVPAATGAYLHLLQRASG
jgi:glycosyltransferase involved in cell wall biosynthesis